MPRNDNDKEFKDLFDKYIQQNQALKEKVREIEFLKRDNERLRLRKDAIEWALYVAVSNIRSVVDKEIESKYSDNLELAG